MLLQVVSDSGNVGGCLKSVGKSNSRDLTKCRVGLLGARGRHLGAYASLLRCRLIGSYVVKGIEALLKHGCFGLIGLIGSSLSD